MFILGAVSIVIGLYICSIPIDSKTVQCEGCVVKGECKPHGSEWYDANLCINYRCRRYRQGQGKEKQFVYELLPDSNGCPYKSICLRFGGYVKDEATCVSYSCYKTYEYTPVLKKFYHGHIVKTKKYGCKDGGGCRMDKAEWKDGCNKKRCAVKGNKTEIHVNKIGENEKCQGPVEEYSVTKFCQGKSESSGESFSGCFDVKRNCWPIGTKGILTMYKWTGKLHTTCECMKHGLVHCLIKI